MSIDTSVYYRLTTEVITDSMSGGSKNVVLEFVEEPPLPSGRMVIAAEARPYRGQFWKFVELTGQLRGRYHLVSASAGDAFHLVSDEFRRFISGNAILTQGNVIPSWSLDPNSDGTYCLSYDDQWGVRQHLAVAPATWSIKKTGQEYTPELYEYLSFSAIFVAGSPPANPPSRFRLTKVVPDLAGGTTVRMTLGPTDYSLYKKPTGTVKGVMLFVDFMKRVSDPTGTAAKEAARSAANILLGANNADDTVHLSADNFAQAQIKVQRSRTVTLVNDSDQAHTITNGRWEFAGREGSLAHKGPRWVDQPQQESGAPTVSNLVVAGKTSQTIGPFNTPGTYHFYCTLHKGMNLTVEVVDYKVQTLYQTQSFKKLTLQVDVRSELGWRQPIQARTDPSFFDHSRFEPHRDYIAVAAKLFTSEEVSFSAYDFVVIVPPRQADLPKGTAWTFANDEQHGADSNSPGKKIRWAVTFGDRFYTRPHPYALLMHEVGHLFGLPDLYPFDEFKTTYNYPSDYKTARVTEMAGCWPVMSQWWYSESFLGWERHKMGWLDPWRIFYLFENVTQWKATLTPLSDNSGLSMVVLPVVFPSGNLNNPSKVLVVEVAQPVFGARQETEDRWVSDETTWGEGVLLYTVDATIATGQSPLRILPKTVSRSDQYGDLYEAPWQVDDSKVYEEGNVSITVTVLEKVGSSYKIRIDYQRK